MILADYWHEQVTNAVFTSAPKHDSREHVSVKHVSRKHVYNFIVHNYIVDFKTRFTPGSIIDTVSRSWRKL